MGIKPGDERYPDDVVAAYRAQIADPADGRGDVRGLPRGRDDRPRARRRGPRHAHDRLPGAGAVGRRGRAAALLRGPARAVAPVRAGDRPAARSRARRTSSSRTPPARSRTTSPGSSPRARRPAASRSASIPPRERRRLDDLQVVAAEAVGEELLALAEHDRRVSSTSSSTRPSSSRPRTSDGLPHTSRFCSARARGRARTGRRRGSSSCSSRRSPACVETTYLGIELNLSEKGRPSATARRRRSPRRCRGRAPSRRPPGARRR